MTRLYAPAALSLFLLACGGQARQASVDEPNPSRPVAQAAPASSAVPTDFAIESRGGAVAAWMGGGMTVTRTRISPGATLGSFDVVVEESTTNEMGHEENTHETQRVAIPAARIEAMVGFILAHRSELEALCENREIMDGGYSQFIVHAAGETLNFQCTNASTPAFSQLQTLYAETIQEALGS